MTRFYIIIFCEVHACDSFDVRLEACLTVNVEVNSLNIIIQNNNNMKINVNNLLNKNN